MAQAPPAYLMNNERFQQQLKERGNMSLVDFEKKSGVPLRTLYNIQSGKYDIAPRTVRDILEALPGVTFEYLFQANPDVPSRAELAAAS